jgi:transaldolase
MEIFADTADVAELRDLVGLGLIDGVTTNPSLMAKTGRPFMETLSEICSIVPGPVSAEVIAVEVEAMVAEGRNLAQFAPNIVVKLPLTLDGLMACRILTAEGLRTNVTLCFSAGQALLAAKSGATYISPFVGRLNDISADGPGLVEDIAGIYRAYGYGTKVLAASVRTAREIEECARRGADAVTAPPGAIRGLVAHVLTDKGLKTFLADAEAARLSIR